MPVSTCMQAFTHCTSNQLCSARLCLFLKILLELMFLSFYILSVGQPLLPLTSWYIHVQETLQGSSGTFGNLMDDWQIAFASIKQTTVTASIFECVSFIMITCFVLFCFPFLLYFLVNTSWICRHEFFV